MPVGLKRNGFADESDEGRDDESSRECLGVVEGAEHLYRGGRQTDLLFAFAQRGGLGGGVARVDRPAGEGDLPLVGPDAIGPLHEDDVSLPPVEERQQHGSLDQRALGHDPPLPGRQPLPRESGQLIEHHDRGVTGP